MGVCSSSEAQKQFSVNQQIDKEQRELKQQEKRVIKLLLLGPGECGKSTILKQMRILRLHGYEEEERKEYRRLVYSNVLTSIQQLVDSMGSLGILFHDPTLQEKSTILMKETAELERKLLDTEMWDTIWRIWHDVGVQNCYARNYVLQLNDSTKYFFDGLERISKGDYIPTEQDILRVRVATIGLVELIFNYKALVFRVIDVGGQRSERRKWIHQFENVNTVIFIIAINEYDKTMREDETMNRLTDAMELFENMCNSQWFAKTEMILFLNKTDLFRAKIQQTPITCMFPDYTGPASYDESVAFIRSKMNALNSNDKRLVNTHETCATDSEQVQKVIANVIDMTIDNNMKKRGLA